MAGIGSPAPYIKDEPEEFRFDNSRFLTGMNTSNQYQPHGQQYGSWQGSMGNDISDFAMGGGQGMRVNYGSQQNMSSNFIAGNSVILDDELADLLETDTMDQNHNHQNGFGATNQIQHDNGFNLDQYPMDSQMSSALPVHQRNQYMSNIYSQTPEGSGPIQSPFIHSFDYRQFAASQPQQQQMAGQPRRPSANLHHGSFDMNSRVKNTLRQERKSSTSRSPMTPKTPAINGLQIGTPDSSAFAGQTIPVNPLNRGHRKTPSAHWDNTFSSGPSYIDSPLASPHSGSVQPQISGVLNGTHTASLPTQVEQVAQSAPHATVDAKRQKRRQSHNAVERRRRDNINDRIQELARLVPAHRLDDDKLRKHLSTNSPFPSLGGTGLSPPQATSLLAGGTGRRAAGSITQGLPIDDKDKGAAKGDVLNGAVGWARDLMWLADKQLRRENHLVEMLARHGDQLDARFQPDENEKRMQSELIEAVQRNNPNSFCYSRAHGSGLWVPKYTDHTGVPLQSTPSQAFPNAYAASNSGVDHMNQDNSLWEYNNMINDDQGDFTQAEFKEEEEFGMEM